MTGPGMATFLAVLAVATFAAAYAINKEAEHDNDTTATDLFTHPATLRSRDNKDPTDYSWVRSLAALGDSFTAGIGAGNNLGTLWRGGRGDWKCSRYDLAYPQLVRNVIGPSVRNFQFPACSGHRSTHIVEQVHNLEKDIDLVLMTAGGNDLCLAGIIKSCIILPYGREGTCDAVIAKAEENIDTILRPNLRDILLALDHKMAEGGVVVYSGYGQYFNTESTTCRGSEVWAFGRLIPKYFREKGLELTIDRRTRFNDLVVKINDAIRDTINELTEAKSIKYEIGFSNWDPWTREGVKGQMCDPSSSGSYPDLTQPDLQFFKPSIDDITHDELKRRQREPAIDTTARTQPDNRYNVDPSIYDTILWKTPYPEADALHRLDNRAPSAPDCPGDSDWFDPTLGLGLPDSWGKLFHPNEQGHETIASFALAKGIDLRARVLGVEGETCAITDEFKCWQKEGRKNYATSDRMDESIQLFCDDVNQPDHEVGWAWEKTFHKGTPDEHQFIIQLSDKVGDFDKNACIEAFSTIVHGCDGNDPENPLNWKFGGRWQRDEYTYEINVVKTNRPWPPIKKTYGSCTGKYWFSHSSFVIEGAGFSSWDSGRDTILPSMKGCLGLGITAWDFKYFDSSSESPSGHEWRLTFNTPVFVTKRCFRNNKVVMKAGGFTNGCSGDRDA